MTDNDRPLTPLQLDILELEERSWAQPGAKHSEFRRRHPLVTETAYYLALWWLLTDRRAYEHDNRRYAAMLTRLHERHGADLARRAGFRTAG